MSEYHLEAPAKLPPGWDCKYDPNTGFYFYINYLTKKTTFEDPRLQYNTNQPSISTSINSNDTIPMQPLHGSPYHVYPMNNHPPTIHAFQGPPPSHHSVSASPLLTNRLHQQLEMMTPNATRPSTPRTQLSRMTNVQETSFIAPLDIESSIMKVNTMFPTVPENHIRVLFKKYHNREAVIISALQVEKHPLTTPGPYATPPMVQRQFQNGACGSVALDYSSLLQTTMSRCSPIVGRAASCASGSLYNGSPKPDGYRQSPKPHSSPKMKLRYLKSIFPKAEETLILDALANCENNVQQASEQLIECGFEKKDTTIPKMSMRKKDEAQNEIKRQREKEAEQNAVPVPPKATSPEEREALKDKLHSKYASIEERIISMALESVDYSEDKAIQILNIVVADKLKEDKPAAAAAEDGKLNLDLNGSSPGGIIAQQPPPPARSISKGRLSTSSSKTTGLKLIVTASTPLENDCSPAAARSFGRRTEQQPRTAFCRQKPTQKNLQLEGAMGGAVNDQVDSVVTSTNSMAIVTNKLLARGPNDDLLLVDYVVWNGANPGLARGSIKSESDLSKRYVPKGSNPELCKGPQKGLNKGSLYSKVSPSLLWV